jgi:MFS family permease
MGVDVIVERIHWQQADRVMSKQTSDAMPHRQLAFWVVAASYAVLVSAASAPSPLYDVYQAEYRFSAITLTVIFAVYVFALLISLLTVGRLSDYVGRRVVIAGALIVDAGAMALFLGENGVAMLMIARVVQGFATGSALGAFSAYLLDLQPSDGTRQGSLVGAAAPTFGLGLGAAVTGVLVQYAPHPTRLIFATLTPLLVLLALAIVVLPETVARVPGALAALRPEVAVPIRAKRAFVGSIPPLVATWALGGLYLSLAGSLLHVEFKQTNEALIGVLIALPFAVAAATAWLLHDVSPPALIRLGGAGLTAGAALLLVALGCSSIALFAVSAVVAGAGFGPANLGAIRSVSQLTEEHERAALLSAVFVVSYLAFSLPALAAGLLITHVGLRSTSLEYGGFLGIVALATFAYESVTDSRREKVPLPSTASSAAESGSPGWLRSCGPAKEIEPREGLQL